MVSPDALCLECDSHINQNGQAHLTSTEQRLYLRHSQVSTYLPKWVACCSSRDVAVCIVWNRYYCYEGKVLVVVRALGICKLCWHNFEDYRDVLAFENNASIIGPIPKHYRANFTSVLKFQPKQVIL